MPALVAIEVTLPPCEPAVEQSCAEADTASLLDACNGALHAGACVSGGFGVNARHTARVAVRSPTSVAIEVRSGDAAEPPTTRVLTFEPGDELAEMWRTLGLTTALMVEGREQPSAVLPPPPFVALVSARVVGASGFGPRSPKAGGQLYLGGRAWQAPWLVGASLEYTSSGWATPGVNGEVTWTELGLGVGAVFDVAPGLELIAHANALAQRLAIVGEKKKDVAVDALWQAGARGGIDLVWSLHQRWFGVIGAHATWVAAPVELHVEDRVVDRIPAGGGGVSVGLQYRF